MKPQQALQWAKQQRLELYLYMIICMKIRANAPHSAGMLTHVHMRNESHQ